MQSKLPFLLVSVMANVDFDTETGCWLYPEYLDHFKNMRYLTWELWHRDDPNLYVFLDEPFCRPMATEDGIVRTRQFCISPLHSTSPALTRALVAA